MTPHTAVSGSGSPFVDAYRTFTHECAQYSKDGWEYILTIPYETDEELDRIIYDDILWEATRIADLRNGFIEANVVSLDDPERSW